MPNDIPSSIHLTVLRPNDMLALSMRFYNFEIVSGKLHRNIGKAYVSIIFQPQSVGEVCGKEDLKGMVMPHTPALSLLADSSRLVFTVPNNFADIPLSALTIETLLDWSKFNLKVNLRAQDETIFFGPVTGPVNKGALQQSFSKGPVIFGGLNSRRGISKDDLGVLIRNQVTARLPQGAITTVGTGSVPGLSNKEVAMPEELETSIEVPLRLFLSPHANVHWLHNKQAIPAKGLIFDEDKLYELWHTRLANAASFVEETSEWDDDKILRALWAVEAKSSANVVVPVANEFDKVIFGETSIRPPERHAIVHESSNFSLKEGKFKPSPIKARKMMLSALGGWLDSLFSIKETDIPVELKTVTNVIKWRHLQTMAREHYVEIVTTGYIMPFGHHASLITITERKPHLASRTATNFRRQIVVITEPVKYYNYRDNKGKFLEFPFSRVEMVTTATPLLESTEPGILPVASGDQFVIKAGGKEFFFTVRAEDVEGNVVTFQLPLAFISNAVSSQSGELSGIISAYNQSLVTTPSSKAVVNGKKVALARQGANGESTTFETRSVQFGMMMYPGNPEESQGFLPITRRLEIVIPAYKHLTGKAKPLLVNLVDDDNTGKVYAKFQASENLTFDEQSDKTGGFVTPNFFPTGLSKITGPFGGGMEDFKNGVLPLNPATFFNDESKIFGTFKLSDFVKLGSPSSLEASPKGITDQLPSIPRLLTTETEDSYITSYQFKPALQNISLGIASLTFLDGATFSINSQVITPKNGKKPKFTTEAALGNFEVGIFPKWQPGLIYLKFKQIRFFASSDSKVDVSVDMDGSVQFGGPLTFLNEFTKLIQPDGFSDPPYLDVSPAGVKSGYTLALPNLQLGAFTLSHVSLSADVNLPFTGSALTVGFRFCERQQPFTLTVGVLGGGGFFGVEMDFHGLRQLEAAFEFGAAVALNLKVASGAVSIMAGIYFKITFDQEAGANSTQLTGYVRINGAMSVIGLITASLEFYMELSYLTKENKAYGKATVKIKVEVLFFSKTVPITAIRTFAGSGEDPSFQMMMHEEHWKEYCAAFAA